MIRALTAYNRHTNTRERVTVALLACSLAGLSAIHGRRS